MKNLNKLGLLSFLAASSYFNASAGIPIKELATFLLFGDLGVGQSLLYKTHISNQDININQNENPNTNYDKIIGTMCILKLSTEIENTKRAKKAEKEKAKMGQNLKKIKEAGKLLDVTIKTLR